jgi:hypothetical protein
MPAGLSATTGFTLGLTRVAMKSVDEWRRAARDGYLVDE